MSPTYASSSRGAEWSPKSQKDCPSHKRGFTFVPNRRPMNGGEADSRREGVYGPSRSHLSSGEVIRGGYQGRSSGEVLRGGHQGRSSGEVIRYRLRNRASRLGVTRIVPSWDCVSADGLTPGLPSRIVITTRSGSFHAPL